MLRKTFLATAATAAIAGTLAACGGGGSSTTASAAPVYTAASALATATPIKHVVVIYQENVSF
ncbi:MAG: phospholipase, partial [Thiomonas sp.]